MDDHNGTIQLGIKNVSENNNSDSNKIQNIFYTDFSKYIIKGSFNKEIIPTPITNFDTITTDMHNPLQSTLISLPSVEFKPEDAGKTFGDPQKERSYTYTLYNCQGESITLRTSNYTTFANEKLPRGRGNITGIFGIFTEYKQILIRSIADVHMEQSGCEVFPKKYLFPM